MGGINNKSDALNANGHRSAVGALDFDVGTGGTSATNSQLRCILSFHSKTFGQTGSVRSFHETIIVSIEVMFLSARSNLSDKKIKSSLHSRYYTVACNEWRGPSLRLSAWAIQLQSNVAV